MTLRPLGDRVLVLLDAKREQTTSGLHLPQDRYEPEVSGVVVACGARCSAALAPGQHVTFAPHAGQVHVLEGQPYLILRESDIAAVLESA